MSGVVARLALVVVGQVCFGIGIGLLFLADLGVGPWDVLHDGLSGRLDRAPGTVTIGLGALLVLLLVLFRPPIGNCCAKPIDGHWLWRLGELVPPDDRYPVG